ncbi:hypothetical protein [Butyrivibrio sp.]|uniref:hypothetical protein n=1 Tax=Butyrivibrio sp. TaxID=28121 RepID=UPI0025C0F14B|nr:hypothetical protein [Butyrivibrio sp.]MBQ9303158.1 hypothetical protein [Butyrivibrio sp.]
MNKIYSFLLCCLAIGCIAGTFTNESMTSSAIQNNVEDIATKYNGQVDYFNEPFDCNVNTSAIIYEISINDAITKINNHEEFYLLLSANWCPYCRTEIGPLSDCFADNNVPIYYISFDHDKNTKTTYKWTGSTYSVDYLNQEFEELKQQLGEEQLPYANALDTDKVKHKIDQKTILLPSVFYISKGSSTLCATPDIDYHEGLTDYNYKNIYNTYNDFIANHNSK